jgi:hypothetical protein
MLRGNALHGVVSYPALLRRMIRGWTPRRLRHLQFQPTPRQDLPETHMVGSERFVSVLCKHVTFAGSDGASRFPFTFDKVAAGR